MFTIIHKQAAYQANLKIKQFIFVFVIKKRTMILHQQLVTPTKRKQCTTHTFEALH